MTSELVNLAGDMVNINSQNKQPHYLNHRYRLRSRFMEQGIEGLQPYYVRSVISGIIVKRISNFIKKALLIR